MEYSWCISSKTRVKNMTKNFMKKQAEEFNNKIKEIMAEDMAEGRYSKEVDLDKIKELYFKKNAYNELYDKIPNNVFPPIKKFHPDDIDEEVKEK